MRSRVFNVLQLLMVRMLLHLCMHVSHSGARCFRSVLEQFSGLQCCRTSLSYSFVPCWHWILRLLSSRVLYVAVDVALRMLAVSFLGLLVGGSGVLGS